MTPPPLDLSSFLGDSRAAIGAICPGEEVRRERARPELEHAHFIDGAHPEPRAALDAMPAPEARSSSEPLESERQDVDPKSERW